MINRVFHRPPVVMVRRPAVPLEPSPFPTSVPQDTLRLGPVPRTPGKLREATGEMALMVDSMQAAEERMKLAGDDLEQAVLQDIWANRGTLHTPMAILDDGSALPLEHSSNIDGFLAGLVADQIQHEEANGSSTKAKPKANHGLLGGHLGIEGTEHVAHGIVGAKSHVAEVANDLLSAKGHAVAESSDGVDAVVSGGQHAVAVNHAAEHGGQVAELMGQAASGWMTALTGALSAGSGVLGVVMLAVGIRDVKHALKHKDVEHAIEGANHMVVGTRSLAAGASMAGHLIHGSEVVTTIAGVAKSALTPLGVIHGAVDAGIGVKHLVEGIRAKDGGKITKGGLGIGLGVSLVAAAGGGGIPAIGAACVFLGGKIAQGIHQHRVCERTSVEAGAESH